MFWLTVAYRNFDGFFDAISPLQLSRCVPHCDRGGLLNDGRKVRFCTAQMFKSVLASQENS